MLNRRFALRALPLTGLLLALSLTAPARAQIGITFSLANEQVTDTGFTFDVMVQADEAGTRLGDTQVYLNYAEDAFGPSVVLHDRIAVTLAEAFQASPAYLTPILNDNTATRVSITTEYLSTPDKGLPLSNTPVPLLHVVMTLVDASHPPSVSFDPKLMQGQQFESDQATAYAPVLVPTTTDGPPKQ